MKRIIFFLLLTSLFLAWMTGCAPAAPSATATSLPTPSAAPTPTTTHLTREGNITFTRYDGQEFYGQVYGHGKTAIILANMAYGGAEQWAPLVKAFDQDKFTVVTFNYISVAQGDYASSENELEAVFEKLKGLGYKRIICMGASMGVSACGFIAHAPEMVGIVSIAGQNFGGTLDVAYPKLFIAGKLDPWSNAITSDYQRADDPKTLITYPDITAHGTSMFGTAVGDQFLKDLLDFINTIP